MEGCSGGAALNTLRVFQWLVSHPNTSVFFGSIGNDDIGRRLSYLVSQAGVDGRSVTMVSFQSPFCDTIAVILTCPFAGLKSIPAC